MTKFNFSDESKKGRKNLKDLTRYINLQLSAMGQPVYLNKNGKIDTEQKKFIELTESLIHNYKAKTNLLGDTHCPADMRIQSFLNEYFSDTNNQTPRLPSSTFTLDYAGIARVLSLPPDKDEHITPLLSSYKIKQGVLHNPKHDRRTTKGSFHIVEGGMPVPFDKIEVPKIVFSKFLEKAFSPSSDLNQLPFTESQNKKAELMVSMLLRPIVCPEVKGILPQRTMEVRFFVPGSLVANLDFVESIFGNGGDPNIPENDAALDPIHWTGHTGCIILAPDILHMKKKDLGIVHKSEATERQLRDGMYWEDENELYNNGNPFKITCRSESGVVVTIIADNYFGYSKKEIKTQIGYSANLLGLVEEEHAGGAIAFARKNLGDSFNGRLFMENILKSDYSYDNIIDNYSDYLDVKEQGYAVDKLYENIIYINEYANIKLYDSEITWEYKGKAQKIKLLPDHFYVHPSGYKIHMEKHPGAPSWRLVSTASEGTFCHKPCTVSGGGKSEISKSLLNAIIYSSFYIQDFEKDFALAQKVFDYDYKDRWKNDENRTRESRSILSPKRSLGSVVKLLTPSVLYSNEYNQFLDSIPEHVKALVLFVKRFYRPERTDLDWKAFFSVDHINGRSGRELLFNNRKIVASYLRVGFANDNSWFLHKLRQDFIASAKIQMEDDITASVVLPSNQFDSLNSEYKNKSIKLTANCESRFFQRPDEAIHRGYDKEAESDLALRNNFTSNYQPLTQDDGDELIQDAINFDLYTKPIQNLIKSGAESKNSKYFITPSHPRLINGEISKNPRYLQIRPDLVNPVDDRLAEMGVRLSRGIDANKPVYHPVNAVLSGRRNNPPEKAEGIRALSVYNPIHFQELPELFMDYICSLTGKSPSTTGAGSEGALTKGPFNMLLPTIDLNNALLSFILSGYNGFSTAAGYVGTESRFDHDISLLVPELWCRLKESERDPQLMIKEKSLERLDDFIHKGKLVKASRLGYRITDSFLFRYMNRIFDEPQNVFSTQMLKPELQDLESYVDGVNNIVEAQQKIALQYFEDESINTAIPPLQILLHIMAYGHYNSKDISDKEIRKMFTREYVLSTDWYKKRIERKQQIDIDYMKKEIKYLNDYNSKTINAEWSKKLSIDSKIKECEAKLKHYQTTEYLNSLVGTIGADILAEY
ncbi:MAG: hypothetical protein N4A49_14810 [Marinifilaceae bacterium]|jgi:hypothetical protein|nr:hypothetical protein [Marinifilaceae bacterium]